MDRKGAVSFAVVSQHQRTDNNCTRWPKLDTVTTRTSDKPTNNGMFMPHGPSAAVTEWHRRELLLPLQARAAGITTERAYSTEHRAGIFRAEKTTSVSETVAHKT